MAFSKEELVKVEQLGQQEQRTYIESLKIQEMDMKTLSLLFEIIEPRGYIKLYRDIITIMLEQQDYLMRQGRLQRLRERIQQNDQQVVARTDHRPEKQAKREGFFSHLCALFSRKINIFSVFQTTPKVREEEQGQLMMEKQGYPSI